MRIGLDTTVLVRLLVGEPRDQTRVATAAILDAVGAGAELLASDLVVAGAYFALQHHYRLSKAQSLAVLRAFFAASPVRARIVEAVLATPNLAAAKPGFIDRLIAASYAASADSVWTFESAAGRLPKVRVLRA